MMNHNEIQEMINSLTEAEAAYCKYIDFLKTDDTVRNRGLENKKRDNRKKVVNRVMILRNVQNGSDPYVIIERMEGRIKAYEQEMDAIREAGEEGYERKCRILFDRAYECSNIVDLLVQTLGR